MLLMLIWWEKKPHGVVKTANLTWNDEASIGGQESVDQHPQVFWFFWDAVLVLKAFVKKMTIPSEVSRLFFLSYPCISKELSLICLILFWYRLGHCTVLSEQEWFSLEENILLPREISATTTTKQNLCCFSTPVTLSSNHKTSSH